MTATSAPAHPPTSTPAVPPVTPDVASSPSMAGAAGLMHGMLASLRLEHPVLAVRPEREQLLVAAWLATYRSVRTRRAYAEDLAEWLAWLHAAELDPLQARRVHVDLWVRQLLDAGAAASSTARRLSALSGWYRHLAEHDLVGANPVAPVRRPRVDADHTATVGLDRDQARALLAAADTDAGPARLRSAAAVRLLLHLGLHVDELARADVADLGHDRGHRTVTVTRKGGGRATLALPAPTGNALVSRAGSRFTVRFRDDRVGVLGPDEGVAAFIPAVDKRGDRLDQLADGAVRAAADGLAGDDPEEDLVG